MWRSCFFFFFFGVEGACLYAKKYLVCLVYTWDTGTLSLTLDEIVEFGLLDFLLPGSSLMINRCFFEFFNHMFYTQKNL